MRTSSVAMTHRFGVRNKFASPPGGVMGNCFFKGGGGEDADIDDKKIARKIMSFQNHWYWI